MPNRFNRTNFFKKKVEQFDDSEIVYKFRMFPTHNLGFHLIRGAILLAAP